MFDTFEQIADQLRSKLAEVDPAVLAPGRATQLLSVFATIERLGASGKALVAARAASEGSWRHQGHQSAACWLAQNTGVAVGDAAQLLDTSKRLGELEATQQALKAGRLSEVQAREIASAAAADPSNEMQLLKAAESEPVETLRRRCGKVRAAALPGEAQRHASIHRRRYLRNWTDFDGAFRLDGRFTPEAGAALLAAIEPYRRQICEQSRKAGVKDSPGAQLADALSEMASEARSGGRGSRRCCPSAMIHVTVDHAALLRGHAVAGETCEIPGIGALPVSVVKAMQADAYLCVLLTDGVDIKAVTKLARGISPRLKRALIQRDPRCVVESCDRADSLEIDHVQAVNEHGPTQLDNLARLCRFHHYLKTYRGYELSGGPGRWMFSAPRGPALLE